MPSPLPAETWQSTGLLSKLSSLGQGRRQVCLMVACVEDLPGLLLKAVFGVPGQICQGPDFGKDFKALFWVVLFLAGKCYISALVRYHANVWVRMCFRRFAMTLQCTYWAPGSRASLKSSLKENLMEEIQNASLIQFLMMLCLSLW